MSIVFDTSASIKHFHRFCDSIVEKHLHPSYCNKNTDPVFLFLVSWLKIIYQMFGWPEYLLLIESPHCAGPMSWSHVLVPCPGPMSWSHVLVHSFIQSGYFYSASSSPLLEPTTQKRSRHNMDAVPDSHAKAPQATASEGLAQGSYVAARAGF